MASDKKSSLGSKPEDSNKHIVNPQGLAYVGVSLLYIATVPLTSFLIRKNGVVDKVSDNVHQGISWLASTRTSDEISLTGKITTLSTLYIFVTYVVAAAGSVAGQASAHGRGRDNNHPRSQIAGLKGLPLRLYSAHCNLIEIIPGYVLATALALFIAPTNGEVVNLLGLHVLAKVFVFYPSYIANLGALRSLSHIIAVASLLNVGLRLAKLVES